MSTHPYWQAPKEYKPHTFQKPIARSIGFQFALPWRLPVTAGFYFGENPVWGRREQSTETQPEYFATDNIIPSSGGIPMINPHTQDMKYRREDHTVKI